MVKKPTYEELEQRVKELEQKDLNHDQVAKNLVEIKILLNNDLYHSGVDAVMATDMDMRILLYNQKPKGFFGYDKEEVIGKSVWEMHLKEKVDPEHLEQAIQTVQKKGIYKYDVCGEDSEGNEQRLHSIVSPLRDEKGEQVGYILNSRDVTQHKKAEEELRENEERFRTTFDNAAIGMALITNDGCFMKVNHTLCRILGYSEEELLGKTWVEITSPDDLPGCYDWLKRVKAGAQSSYEKRFIHKLGHPVWIEVSSSLVRDSQGRIQYYISLFQDIMSRKQAEEALRESEEQYRNIFKNIQDVYYEVTLDGIILETSPSIEDVSLYKREEIIGKSLYDIYFDPKKRDEFLKELLKKGKVTDYEALMIDKDGSQVPCSITAKLLRDKQGNPLKIIGSLRNITGRKRMEESLRQSESQKRAILDASIDRIRYIDKDMKIIWANKTTAMELNISSEDLVGHTCYELFVGRDTPCNGCPAVIARETGKMERAVMCQPKVKGIEGESFWDAYCVPIKNDAGEIESFIQISRNITDQKRAEEHINILTQELMRTQESERQRISRDLHDQVAQELSAVKIGCETLFDHQPEIPPEIRQRVSELSRTLQESIKAVRDVSYDLRPPALDEMGLVEMLVQYCNDFSENNGINVDFHSAGMKKLKLDFDTEINLYRLIQEGLTNIKKHADADHVTIKLVAAFPDIILRIKDNGKGFNVQKRMATLTKEKRMGIHSMVQRAKLLHGEMEIQSRPMQGTKISITLPYKDKNSGSKENHIDNRRPSPFQGRPQSDHRTQP